MNATKSICCRMREHFLVGIVATAAGDTPVEAADFIAWDVNSPKPIIVIKFCPFCGSKIDRDDSLRVKL